MYSWQPNSKISRCKLEPQKCVITGDFELICYLAYSRSGRVNCLTAERWYQGVIILRRALRIGACQGGQGGGGLQTFAWHLYQRLALNNSLEMKDNHRRDIHTKKLAPGIYPHTKMSSPPNIHKRFHTTGCSQSQFSLVVCGFMEIMRAVLRHAFRMIWGSCRCKKKKKSTHSDLMSNRLLGY